MDFTQILETIFNGFNEVFSQLNYAYSVVFILTVFAVRTLVTVSKNKTLFTFVIGTVLAVIYALLTDSNYGDLIISIPFSMIFVGIINRNKWLDKLYNHKN